MKKNLLIIMLVFLSKSISAQVVLSEDFNYPFSYTSSGWINQNNSIPVGYQTWQQFTSVNWPAYNGAMYDFISCGLFSQQEYSNGDISNWLITPTVTIYNGGVLQFATRKEPFSLMADRLQIRMSTSGTVSSIPNTTASVGPFSVLLLDINPNLTTNTTSAVSNGSVNGYPDHWTVYTLTVTGVTGTVTGRFAFRYFVSNGGNIGSASDQIDLDAVRFTLPCNPSVPNYTICSGTTTTITPYGGAATTSYSWSNGSISPSLVVTPTNSSVYSFTPLNGTLSCNVIKSSSVTVSNSLGISIVSSSGNSTICSKETVTLTAYSAATTLTWSNGSSSPINIVKPGGTTVYSVTGLTGLPPNVCSGTASIQINTKPSPTINAIFTPTVFCFNGDSGFVLLSGASTYTAGVALLNDTLKIRPFLNGPIVSSWIHVMGTGTNGCVSTDSIAIPVKPDNSIIVTATSSQSFACVGRTLSLSANGASQYYWQGANNSSTVNTITYTVNSIGVNTVNVVGTSTAGCYSSASLTIMGIACNLTEIEQLSRQNNVSIFPNPTKGSLLITGFIGKYDIYDMRGTLILSGTCEDNVHINMEAFSKGIYIIRCYDSHNPSLIVKKIGIE